MNHDILKRLGLDHIDVDSPDFLRTLNRLQQEARENLRQGKVPSTGTSQLFDPDAPPAGFDWIEPANLDLS